ncbi:MAG: hypothetical protein ABII68_05015 [Pseudomonadota bacterium]
MPKETCARDCQVLQAVQDIQAASGKNSFLSGIDCTEESRYAVSFPLTRTFDTVWTA